MLDVAIMLYAVSAVHCLRLLGLSSLVYEMGDGPWAFILSQVELYCVYDVFPYIHRVFLPVVCKLYIVVGLLHHVLFVYYSSRDGDDGMMIYTSCIVKYISYYY